MIKAQGVAMPKIAEAYALSVVEWIGSGVGRVMAADLSRPITIVRWLLVVPAAVSGFFAAFYVVGFAVGSESNWAVMAALASAVLGAPVLVVLFGAAMAPSHRTKVAWAVYLAGLAVAARMSWRMPPFLIAAATAGACAAGLVHWYSGRTEKTT